MYIKTVHMPRGSRYSPILKLKLRALLTDPTPMCYNEVMIKLIKIILITVPMLLQFKKLFHLKLREIPEWLKITIHKLLKALLMVSFYIDLRSFRIGICYLLKIIVKILRSILLRWKL
jgi:hypothetical protein